MSQRKTLTATSLVVLAVLFVALTVLSNTLLRRTRVDLTENGLYTLSEGTRNILAGIKEPINLYFFFSDQATQEFPQLRNYASRVRELLDEFVLRADGQIKLHVIDPPPFSEEEDRAARFGLQAIPVGAGGDKVYFGLAGTNSLDGVDVIPFFQPDKEAFLEYDLSKLVYNLAHPKKPVIGLLSTLPIDGGFDPASGGMRAPWVFTQQLRQLFEVRSLDTGIASIDPDIDILLLVHPKGLSEQTQYAIDQFVLKGGKAMVFLDPYSEIELARNPGNPTASMFADRSSALPKLLQAWGVEMDPKKVLADHRYALTVSTRPNQAPVRHLGILDFDSTALARDDVVTAQLNHLTVAMSGFLKQRENAQTQMLPLITSSQDAMPMAVDQFRMLSDPSVLQRNFKPTGERYVVAARIQGKVKSAFPEGPPGSDAEKSAETEEKKPENTTYLAESTQPINVIVVADTDLLSDRLWVRKQDFFGNRVATAWADNGAFAINALDNLAGNSDLISIRSRATATRPFTTVEDLQRKAENKFRATEQQLQAQLEETEHKLNQLQKSRADDNLLILSDEQRAELERFQQKKLEIRKELRQVQRNLDKNIEQLGTTLKMINIGLMPLLVSGLALAAAGLRIRRRKTAGGV